MHCFFVRLMIIMLASFCILSHAHHSEYDIFTTILKHRYFNRSWCPFSLHARDNFTAEVAYMAFQSLTEAGYFSVPSCHRRPPDELILDTFLVKNYLQVAHARLIRGNCKILLKHLVIFVFLIGNCSPTWSPWSSKHHNGTRSYCEFSKVHPLLA